ncbi:VOC family protein [Nocardioides sp.]|uniref:VOC family protein n=1 Tax=Nocardioides sp. TaxID=35761 RepID=UPI0027358CA1|nr:VOC family protein [Nocardioides sp.]MDP3891068.1 VOC family protein [Nocardioides sp.]
MTGREGLPRLGHVIVPSADLDELAAFYVDGLGLDLRFRDGERYAAVTDGTVTLGLAAAGEQPVAGQVVVSVEVAGLDALLAAWAADGFEVGSPVDGPHERRAVVRDPSGNPVVVYEKRT